VGIKKVGMCGSFDGTVTDVQGLVNRMPRSDRGDSVEWYGAQRAVLGEAKTGRGFHYPTKPVHGFPFREIGRETAKHVSTY
jgi:hypothetical protein